MLVMLEDGQHAQIIAGFQTPGRDKRDPEQAVIRQCAGQKGPQAGADRLGHVDDAHDGRPLAGLDDGGQERRARGDIHALAGRAQPQEKQGEAHVGEDGNEGEEDGRREVREDHGLIGHTMR